ncbi:MAG TPA: hypothetical protein VFS39_16065 [Nitrospira sp.]|nr:hypothetical protein [Nitrospira sp.]
MPADSRPDPGPPLWSIGFAVAVMLGAPLLIYSIAPAGPIREGDTIFPEGAAKVPLANPLLYEAARFDGTCLLDPQDPLIVVQRPADRPDGLILGKVQGKTVVEWPFCPPQAEVLLTPGQIVQKPDVWEDIKTRVVRIFGR